MLTSRQVLFSVPGQTTGTVPYFSGSAWVGLNPGSPGWFLMTQGPGAAPIWSPAPGGKIRVAGTTTTTPSVSIPVIFPSFFPFTGLRIVEVNLALQETSGPTEEAVLIRALLDSSSSLLDLVVSSSGSGSGAILDMLTGPQFTNASGDLVVGIPLNVTNSVLYRISVQEA